MAGVEAGGGGLIAMSWSLRVIIPGHRMNPMFYCSSRLFKEDLLSPLATVAANCSIAT